MLIDRFACRSRRWVVAAAGLALIALLARPPAAPARTPDRAAEAAIELITRATTPQPNGAHHRLLRALRHLEDPALRPFFEALTEREQASLRVHGILGLAKLSEGEPVLVKHLARLEDEALRSELITAALDNDLLGASAARQILQWDGLKPGARVLLAARLIEAGSFDQPEVLRQALQTEKPARRALAALLLAELGEVEDWTRHAAVGALGPAERHRVALTLLRIAMRHEIAAIGRWARDLSESGELNARVQRLALRAALRFEAPGAVEAWTEQFEQAEGPADRIRLALLALRLAPWVPAEMFEALTETEAALLQQMGAAGRAIAGGDQRAIADRVVRLVKRNHPATMRWAIGYAQDEAKRRPAQMILLGVILASREAEHLSQSQRLDIVSAAARALHERDGTIAARLLRPVVKENRDQLTLVRGVLLGLVRTQKEKAADLLKGLEPFSDLTAANLAALLRARHGMKLSASQMDNLRRVVQGGGAMRASLRLQAGWLYLKRRGQVSNALARVEAQ